MTARGGIINEGESGSSYPLAKMIGGGGRRKIVHLDPSTVDRVPPHSNDAEMAVLGAMMLEKDAASRVVQLLNAESFYRESHRVIYQAMVSLADRNQPIDIITLNDELRRMGKLAEVGGSHYLSELNMRTPTAANIEHHARIVFEKALKRRLISTAMEMISNCYAETTDAFEELDKAEQQIFQIAESRGTRGYHTMKRLAVETVEMLETISARRSEGGGVIGVPSGLVKLDNLTGGFQKSDMIIIAARPSMGKCLAAGSRIVLADGSVSTIEQIYRSRNAAQPVMHTLGLDWKFRQTTPSDYIDDGIKPLFRVVTRTGRSIETTLTHPYLTVQGWRHLSELSVGDRIAVPRRLEVFGSHTMPEHEVSLLGLLLGDGTVRGSNSRFTNDNRCLQDEFRGCVAGFENVDARDDGGYETAAPCPLTRTRHVRKRSRSAHEKSIPATIFQLRRSLVSLFINRLFATDGWASVYASGQSQIGYASASQQLVRQLQHLLLRFGIVSSIRRRAVRYNGSHRESWQLEITDARSMRTFIDEIGILGKQDAIDRVEAALGSRRYQTNRDLIPVEIWERIARAKGEESWASLARRAGLGSDSNIHVGTRSLTRTRLAALAAALDDAELIALADSDVYWDEIVAIESMGPGQVYDLTIPDTHNFVANDICVHNTGVALSLTRNTAIDYKKPVAFFSLEMSAPQLVLRLISAEAKVDAHRLRTGDLKNEDWQRIVSTIHRLTEAPIFIDDTPALGIMDLRARARLMKREHDIELIVVDYLQLMHAKAESREREISMISRGLKQLAKELDIPIIALSQLNRSVESRGDKRPMLSDLRESGCLTGDTLVTIADTGERVPIASLEGRSGFGVWAYNETTGRIERHTVSRAFSTGVKQVYRITTRMGRTIRATANHKFLTPDGWHRLDELEGGTHLAIPRALPEAVDHAHMDRTELALLGHLVGGGTIADDGSVGYSSSSATNTSTVALMASRAFRDRAPLRLYDDTVWHHVEMSADGGEHPVGGWLDRLGLGTLDRSAMRLPERLFRLPAVEIACFVRHLWSACGRLETGRGDDLDRRAPVISCALPTHALASDVASLLLRLGINARIEDHPNRSERFVVSITSRQGMLRYATVVGAAGADGCRELPMLLDHLHALEREIEIPMGMDDLFEGEELAALKRANTPPSDAYWDPIVSIEPDGVEEVFDLTVPGPHNFVAGNIIVHNSIEQDADVVMFVHRPEYYGITVDEDGMPTEGTAELIIGKQRNGPTGVAKTAFIKEYARFENLAFQYDNAPEYLPPSTSDDDAPF